MTGAVAPDPDALPALDTAYLVRQTFADQGLQRDLLTLFSAQCDRLLPEIVSHPGPDVAFAVHTLRGAASAIGAARVAALAGQLERALAGDIHAPGAVALQASLAAAIAEAKAAIASLMHAA